jgi:hypothetical protein
VGNVAVVGCTLSAAYRSDEPPTVVHLGWILSVDKVCTPGSLSFDSATVQPDFEMAFTYSACGPQHVEFRSADAEVISWYCERLFLLYLPIWSAISLL